MLTPMRILVTGGAGFIGSHVVDLYIERGHQVSVVDNLSTGRKANINPRANFYEMDIRSPDLNRVFEVVRPEIVNHHAAQIQVSKSTQDPAYDADVNILGSLNLAKSCSRYGTEKLIYASSGGAIYGEPVYIPCDEKLPIQPISPYGVSKYAFELYLALPDLTHELRTVILRYPNVYGPRQIAHGDAGVIAIFCSRMLDDQAVTIYGSGEQTRDFIYVEDCARANLLALEDDVRGTFVLGSGAGTSILTLFDHLRVITGCIEEPIFRSARPGEIEHSALDASYAHRELGWKPVIDLEQGLSRTIEFFTGQVSDEP